MLSIVNSMALNGINGYLISIQVDISAGMPVFEIVGLPDISVKESKQRVKTAIKNCGIEFLSRRIIVNLAPADIKKEGSMFDLPIAVGILISSNNISNKKVQELIEDTIFIGELSLSGKIQKVNGILPICIEARKLGIKKVILPKENAKEAAIIDELEIFPVENLIDVIEYLNGEIKLERQEVYIPNMKDEKQFQVDFSEVKGQESAKRALEIAAAGGHNCILIRKSRYRKNYASKKNYKHTTKYYF